MIKDPSALILKLVRGMRPDRVERVLDFARALANPPEATWSGKGFATKEFASYFGDALRVHHLVSVEAFTKDKFEHAMAAALRKTGLKAVLAPRGNPGHDLTVDGEKWSLKTQADVGIKRDVLHISKFMELGKGKWETKDDLPGLRNQCLITCGLMIGFYR